MNSKSLCLAAVLVAIGVLASVAPARADGYVAPSVGINFGGDAGGTFKGSIDDSSKVSYGLAAGMMSGGIFGVEEDFTYTHNFFGNGGSLQNNRVITLMTNVIVGIPIGGVNGAGVRPYVSAGIGLINRNVESGLNLATFSANDFGYDAGAGVMGYFATHVGLRVDYRYFRNFNSTDSNPIGLSTGQFNFSRASAGVLFRF